MESNNDDEIIDFDGDIQNDGEAFTTLPDGDEVEFTVEEVTQGHNKAGTKPQVTIKLACRSVMGHGRTTIMDYIPMTRSCEWKLCEFFTAMGLRKHGERLRLRWDIQGKAGRAYVSVDEFVGRDGDKRKSNKIKKYLEPKAEAAGDAEPSFV